MVKFGRSLKNIVVISVKIYWKSGRELTDLEEGAIAENDGVVFWRLFQGGSYCSAGGLVQTGRD